jgi:hypothetical protein
MPAVQGTFDVGCDDAASTPAGADVFLTSALLFCHGGLTTQTIQRT